MPATGSPAEGAGPGQTISSASSPTSMQLVRFASAEEESQFVKRMGAAMRRTVRLVPPEDSDVEGHLLRAQEDVVLATLALDDDVAGHVISIRFPNADQARHFRNQLLAAGALTASVALGIGASGALHPSLPAAVSEPASQAVWMDTTRVMPELGGTAPAAQRWVSGDKELWSPETSAASESLSLGGTAPAAQRWVSGDKELWSTETPTDDSPSLGGTAPAAQRWVTGDEELTR